MSLSLLQRLDRRQRMVTWSSFMVPVDRRSGFLLQSQPGTTPFQSGRTLLANGKGVLNVNSHCPFLLISGALIKNRRKYTHSLWEFSREEIYCFSPLQELFFFSLFLWQPLVFLLLHYFVLLQQKGQGGFWTETDLSWEWIIQRSNFCFESALWSRYKGWLSLDKEDLTAWGLNFRAKSTRNQCFSLSNLKSRLAKTTFWI